MNRNLLWRGVTVFAVIGIAALLAFPVREKVNLGLDLRGGMHLRLQVQTADAVRAENQNALDRVLVELRRSLPDAAGRPTGVDEFEVRAVPADRDAEIGQLMERFLPGWERSRAGEVVRFRMTPQYRNEIADMAVTQALQTIRNRVDEFGVAEPVIQREGLGGDRIVVQLPGVDDPDRVKELIRSTAFLEFRLVEYPGPEQAAPSSRQELLARFDGRLPEHLEILPSTIRDARGEELGTTYYAVHAQSIITGRDMRTARPSLDDFNAPAVSFQLTHAGGQLFGRATGENVGRGLAIVLDGNIVSAPRINDRITDSGVITGRFNVQETEDLAMVLRSGALPAGITYLEERTVGPSLGQDSIRQGLHAGLIGAALVVLVILVVYTLTGFNAILALAVNVIVVFGALAYFGANLTLPGIAGIILTVGMAVDANVLIFERIREELRHGRTVKSAVDSGFGKALSSILDANITTLIAALFLFQFGTGPVRGFAVTLSIGILASLFTAIFASRWIFDMVLARRRRVERLWI